MLRDAIVCSAVIVCAATTTGSTLACGAMACAPLPAITMVKRSAAASSGPGRMPNFPERGSGPGMHAIELVDAEAADQPVLQHGEPTRQPFLVGLEDHAHRAVEVARLAQVLGGAEQHGCVAVVAAGVHLARSLGGIRNAGCLQDRQRIHVGAQAHHPARRGLAALDNADHAGLADAGHDLVAPECRQLVGNDAGRAVHVEAELGMLVQILAPLRNFVLHSRDTVDDWHGVALLQSVSIKPVDQLCRYPES